MNDAEANTLEPKLKYFHSPKTLIRRFTAKSIRRSSIILGVVFGVYMFSKASSFLTTYPTELLRQKLAESLGSNVGIEALLGVAHHIDTVPGYMAWNFLCLVAAGGAVWGLLTATKIFRGQEDSGRWELLLAGQTTARRAAANALLGLASGLVIIYVFLALFILIIGKLHGASFSTSSSLFFALALVCAVAEFLAVGALASQLMPVRSRSSGLAAIIFGIFYAIRLVADSTNAHWLLNVSPLGWIERLQPMYASQPLWLLPIGGFVLIVSALAVYFAGKRDLGVGIFADKDTAKARTRLLRTPLGATIRLTRAVSLSWLLSIGITSFLYGLLAKGAVQAFTDSAEAKRILERLTQAAQTQEVTAFLGITFFLVMVLTMFYAANGVGKIRDDEAEGYVDNFLVRPISRFMWLWGRIVVVFAVVVSAGLVSSLGTWAGQATQHAGVAFHTLLLAGTNAMAPVLLILGIGIFAFGVAPRLTSVFTYTAIGWSFLIATLSSGLSLNHWLLDTSILHDITFAPAVSPNWTSVLVVSLIALVLAIAGTFAFNARDLALE